MNTAAYFSAPKTLRRIHAGPLGPYVDEFASWLQEQHYSRSSGQTSVRAVANWSRWLQVRHIAARDIDAKLLDRYFLYVTRAGSLGPDDRRALQKMLTWLQKIGVASATCFSSPVNQRKTVGDDFEQYMLQQCGLSPVTLRLYLPFISLFLRQRFGEGPIKLETLVAHDITAFVQRNCRSLGHSSVQHLVTALRVFLRYLRHTGKISIDLAACVPAVANWSFSATQRCISARDRRGAPASKPRYHAALCESRSSFTGALGAAMARR
jgi:site-specific recombinase XerD